MTLLSSPLTTPESLAGDSTPRFEAGHAESLSEWRNLVGRRFVPLTITSEESSFSGDARTIRVGETRLTEITATAHRVRRLGAQIHPDDSKDIKLSLLIEGSGRLDQDGRSATLRPGDVAIYDTSRPYTLQFDRPVRTLVMVFPHHLLGLSEKSLRGVTATRLPGDAGIGNVISPFMAQLAGNLDQLEGANGVRIMYSALNLVTALLSAELAEHAPASDDVIRLNIETLRLYIDTHLADPDLTTTSIARAHYVSSRYLQQLFHEEGLTVSGYIRARRLEQCRVDFCDVGQASIPILSIAQRWGFVDGAHFSRVFKAAYGQSPREYRKHRSAA